jgi:hypothetical protein
MRCNATSSISYHHLAPALPLFFVATRIKITDSKRPEKYYNNKTF